MVNMLQIRRLLVTGGILALSACGGGPGISLPGSEPGPAQPVAFSAFVRSTLSDDPADPPREINDVEFEPSAGGDGFGDLLD